MKIIVSIETHCVNLPSETIRDYVSEVEQKMKTVFPTDQIIVINAIIPTSVRMLPD